MAWSVVGYSGAISGQSGSNTFRLVIDGDYSGPSGTSYTVKCRLRMLFTGSYSPYYRWAHYSVININGSNVYSGQINQPSSDNWTTISEYVGDRTYRRQTVIGEWSAGINPGGPAYNCNVYGSYSISGSATYLPAKGTYEASGNVYLPATWQKPGQTYVTRIANNTSGTVKNSGDQAIDSTWWENNNTNTNYAGDSLTLVWDKNNQASVGNNADPTSRAFFTRDSDNNQDTYDTLLLQPWDWTGGGGDLYNSSNYTIVEADAGKWLKCMMHKSFLNSAGTRGHYLQGALEYVKPAPTVSGNVSLRSKRFYSGTPSCKVWQINSYSTTNNGYGMSQIDSNDNAPGYTNATNVFGKFYLQTRNGGASDATGDWGGYRWGSGAFNANYTLPTALSIHSSKVTLAGTATTSALCYTNWFNPRTGATSRLGYKSIDMGQLSNVTGTIELPTIDSIKPISGNGTTVIVDSTKNIWTNQANVKLNWRVTHSGNSNGFGYDARVNEDSGTYSSTSGQGATLVPVNINSWASPYGVIDNTSDNVTIQHDNTTTAGSQRSIAIVPYIKDGSNYQIFGAANTTNGLVVSTPYTVYRIQAPSVPVLNSWTNTLPAIDGVKDRVQWTATSPSSWGNVTDFTTGFKLRYQIGADKTRSDGYEWYFTDSPSNISTVFSGYFDETYDRSLNTTCNASLAATNRYDSVWNSYLDFQSAFTTARSYNITAKTPYNQTAGTLTMSPSTGNHTVLATEVPFIFTCPNQNSLNATDLVRTTTMIIDGGLPITIEDPTYTLGTADSLTGLRNVTWTALKTTTTPLARGAHTLKVECEVLSYFKSTSPLENNVYLGASRVESPVMDIEVAEYPTKPTMKVPTPAYHNAGQERTMTFPWTTNDWGCLDTTNNNRHFDYQLVNPSGTVISSGTLTKDKTSWSYTFTPNNNDIGTYTFKLRETTVVGSSDYATQTFEILKAVEPDQAEVKTSQIIALDSWNWDLTITPGSNGTFKPVTSTPITRYKVDIIQPGYNMYKPDFKSLTNITAISDGWYKVTGTNTGSSTQYANFFTNYNSHIKADTTYTYVVEVRNANITTTKDNVVRINIGKSEGQAASWADYSIDSDTFTQIDSTSVLEIPADSPNGTYFVTVKTKKDMKSLGGSNYSTPTDNSMLSRDFFPIFAGDDYELEFRVSLVEGTATTADFSYQTYVEPLKSNLVAWTNINNGVNVSRSFTHNFGTYTDGSYWLEIWYERYYTTKTTRDILHTQIIPPEVNISDLSYVVENEVAPDLIPFMVNIEVFASTLSWNCYYTLDYGTTWVQIPLTETDKAKKYFRVKLPLGYLDTVQIKAFGSNPVDQEEYTTQHEMPTSYKAWLAWSNRDSEEKAMLPSMYPADYDTAPSLGIHNPASGDVVIWENHAAKYSTGDVASSDSRGFYIRTLGEDCGMVDGKDYEVSFKIRATQNHRIQITLESLPNSSKNVDLTNEFQTVKVSGTYNASSLYKALTFYGTTYKTKERVYVKDIKISELKQIGTNDFVRRLNISRNGQPSKKVRHINKQ